MFYKKSLSLLVALILTLCATLMSGQIIFAKADALDAQDEYFLDFVREDTGEQQISFTSIPLYNQTLTENGRQYVFTVGGVNGYALTAKMVMGDSVFYEIEELFYNTPAPFTGLQGLPVYLTFQTYLDCVDGVFYDISNNRAVVSSQAVAELAYKGFGYLDGGSGEAISTTETIAYSTKSTDSYRFPYDAPNIDSGTNGACCANTSGAVVIGYYDRFYENLIPNYQPYFMFGGAVVYRSNTQEMMDMLETLRLYMAVEGVEQGTTFTGFQQGMERYVEEHGYTYNTTSVMSWGSFNYESFKQKVSQDIPVAIFLNGYNLNNYIDEETNQDVIGNTYKDATHVVAAIGYRCDTYYNANGSVIATRKYARVISGLVTFGIGYLNVSSNTSGQIVNAIAITID